MIHKINNEYKKIYISTYFLILFIIMTEISNLKYGVFLSGVIAPIVVFILFLFIEKKSLRISVDHGICLLFWISATISTLKSSIVVANRELLTFLMFCFFFIIATAIAYSKSEIKLIIKAYIALIVFCSINILINFVFDFQYGWNRYSLYIFGVYRDPLYVASFMLPAVSIIFYKILIFKSNNIKESFKWYVLMGIITSACFVTGCRSIFLVMVFALLMVFLKYLVNKKVSIIKILLLSCIVIYLLFIIKDILPESTAARLLDVNSYSEDIRLVMWKAGLDKFIEFPILGIGLNGINTYLLSIGYLNSHNVYLDILGGQGIVGISLFAIMIFRILMVSKSDRALIGVITFSFFIPLSFVNGFNTASFWAPLVICQILSNYSRKSNGLLIDTIKEL